MRECRRVTSVTFPVPSAPWTWVVLIGPVDPRGEGFDKCVQFHEPFKTCYQDKKSVLDPQKTLWSWTKQSVLWTSSPKCHKPNNQCSDPIKQMLWTKQSPEQFMDQQASVVNPPPKNELWTESRYGVPTPKMFWRVGLFCSGSNFCTAQTQQVC